MGRHNCGLDGGCVFRLEERLETGSPELVGFDFRRVFSFYCFEQRARVELVD